MFAHNYPEAKLTIPKKRLTAILVWFGFVSLLGLTPLVFSHIDPAKALEKGIIAPQPFIGMAVYALSVFGSLIWSMIILWKKRKAAQRVQRTYFRYLVGTLLLYLVLTVVLSFVFPAALENPSFVQYAPLFILPFVFACAYIIFRHQFVETTRLAATQLFVTGFWLVLLVQVFLAGSFNRMLISTFVLAGSIGFGYLIIRGVFQELEQRKQVEYLNVQLNDFNKNIRKKVDEQTYEVQRAYEVEKKSRLELEELSKTKDQFVLATQHHLRTPLTIIKNYADLLPKAVKENSPHLDEFVAKIGRSSAEMIDLVNELLEVSQIQAGVVSLDIKPVDIKLVFENILAEEDEKIEKKHLSVAMEGNPASWPTVDVDEGKIRRALGVIIRNAVVYSSDGGSVSIKGEEISHPIERDKKILRLTIKDNGLGLTKDELNKLFAQIFERGEEARKINPLGKGIGLVLAKAILSVHKGRLWAESDGRGKGSAFFVELEV
ncbi:MAG: HAMP domain-containing histidine kinase [Candidatus Colwellbacteria bacterium]|nr:HAMP domain-containing histidine kinase [Candidatus Colwellbacteria bacterium]